MHNSIISKMDPIKWHQNFLNQIKTNDEKGFLIRKPCQIAASSLTTVTGTLCIGREIALAGMQVVTFQFPDFIDSLERATKHLAGVIASTMAVAAEILLLPLHVGAKQNLNFHAYLGFVDQENPLNLDQLVEMARQFYQQNDLKALGYITQAIERVNEMEETTVVQKVAKADAYALLASKFRGEFDLLPDDAGARQRASECYKEAFGLYINVADNDKDAYAQYQVGMYLSTGRGVSQNKEEAAKYWQLAADQGHTSSHVCLAGHFHAKQQYQEAYNLWKTAAELDPTFQNQPANFKQQIFRDHNIELID